jgi:hypothetical protein
MCYYHAGVVLEGDVVRWSEHTRTSHVTAEVEAKKMAKEHGGRPVVEYWDRKHGLAPADCDAVSGSYFPMEVRS